MGPSAADLEVARMTAPTAAHVRANRFERTRGQLAELHADHAVLPRAPYDPLRVRRRHAVKLYHELHLETDELAARRAFEAQADPPFADVDELADVEHAGGAELDLDRFARGRADSKRVAPLDSHRPVPKLVLSTIASSPGAFDVGPGVRFPYPHAEIFFGLGTPYLLDSCSVCILKR